MDKGNTAFILTPFLEGMSEAGADVELFYTSKLDIKPCTGEYHCCLKTPGSCYQKDDMQMLYPKLREADIYVFASPIYVNGVTGPMKMLIDRLLPLVDTCPYVVLRDGRCDHFPRERRIGGKVVLVSTCGYWGMVNFDLALAQIEGIAKTLEREFSGALLRSTSRGFREMVEMGAPVGDILEAAREAGRQVVEDGKISAETLNTISREVMPLEVYIERTNEMFREAPKASGKE